MTKLSISCLTAFTMAAAIQFAASSARAAADAVPPLPPGELGAYAAMGSGVATTVGIADLQWTDEQLDAFVNGLRAAHAKRPYPVDAAAGRLLDSLRRRAVEIRTREVEAEDADLAEFLRGARASGAMQQSDSGLLYRILTPGVGPRPRPQDMIVANFSATMPDGQTAIPQLSGEGFRAKVGELPPGLVEGLQMMALGAHAVLVLPPKLSFGAGVWPAGIERGTPILLRVAVLDIIPDTSSP